MNADLFRHFLDHHRLQFVDSQLQKLLLAAHDGVADLHDGLLALLNIFNELNRALKPLLDVITSVAVIALASHQTPVRGIEPQRRYVIIVHHDNPLFAVLHEGDVRLDQPRLRFVVAKPRARIKGPYVLQRGQDRLDRATKSTADFLVLLVLQSPQMLVHDCNRVS